MKNILYINTCPSGTDEHIGNARVAQLVERDLAKVEAAGSSPVSRSCAKVEMLINIVFPFFVSCDFGITLNYTTRKICLLWVI